MFKGNPSNINTNPFQGNKWEFGIAGIPELKYFGTGVPIPGVSLNPALRETPLSTIKLHGDKLTFDPLTIEFIVDEELALWIRTFKWMNGLAPAAHRLDHAKLAAKGKYFDGFLDLYSNSFNPTVSLLFKNCHPTNLGGFNMDYQSDDQMIIKSSLTLEYDYFEIRDLTT